MDALHVNVETVEVEALHLDPANARAHDDRNLQTIKDSLEEFGQVEPLVVHEATGKVIGGNGRLEAMRDLGWEECQVVRLDVDETTATKLAITLNRTAELASWDEEVLAQELETLIDQDIDLGDLWDDEELASLLAEEDPGPLEDPEGHVLIEDPQTSPGDTWMFPGTEHRIVCGDATDADTIREIVGDPAATLLMTSPPYWIGKDYERETSLEEAQAFIWACADAWPPHLAKDHGRVVLNTGLTRATAFDENAPVETILLLDEWTNALRASGWLLRHTRIWAKNTGYGVPKAPAGDQLYQGWEFIATYYHPDGEQRGQGKSWATQAIWEIEGDRTAGGTHTAAYPIEVPERNIRLYTKPGERVLDPFLGSGTTLLACEQLDRTCRGVEIDPMYVDLALYRYHELTGTRAETPDGKTFNPGTVKDAVEAAG